MLFSTKSKTGDNISFHTRGDALQILVWPKEAEIFLSPAQTRQLINKLFEHLDAAEEAETDE